MNQIYNNTNKISGFLPFVSKNEKINLDKSLYSDNNLSISKDLNSNISSIYFTELPIFESIRLSNYKDYKDINLRNDILSNDISNNLKLNFFQKKIAMKKKKN